MEALDARDIPSELGEYRIDRFLTDDGFVAVARGHGVETGEDVFIKFWRKISLSDPAVFARFERELQIINALENPAILPILEIGNSERFFYLVTPYLKNGSLKDRLAIDELSIAEVIEISQQVARGLDAIHDLGILHRKLTPGNILFRDNGTAVVTDLGTYKFIEADRFASRQLNRYGIAYLSPEQVVAIESHDERDDIYSFGTIVYEMLVGHPLHHRKSQLLTALSVVEGVPATMAAELAGFPEEVDTVFSTVLSRDPQYRFQYAGDFVEQLRRALLGEAVDQELLIQPEEIEIAAETESETQLMPRPRSGRLLRSLAAVVVLIFVSILFLQREVIWERYPQLRLEIPATGRLAAAPAVETLRSTPSRTPLPTVTATVTPSPGVSVNWPSTLDVSPPEDADLNNFPDGQPFVLVFNQPMDPESAVLPISFIPALDGSFRWSEDSMTLSFSPDDGFDLYRYYSAVLDPGLSTRSGLIADHPFTWYVKVTTGGTAAANATAIADTTGVAATQTATTFPTALPYTSSGPEIGGSDKLAFIEDNDIWVVNLDGTEQPLRLTTDQQPKTDLQWTPDGRALTFVSNGTAYYYSVAENRLLQMGQFTEFEIFPDSLSVLVARDVVFPNRVSYWMHAIVPFSPTGFTAAGLGASNPCLFSGTHQARFSQDASRMAGIVDVTVGGRLEDAVRLFQMTTDCVDELETIDTFPDVRFTMRGFSEPGAAQELVEFGWNGDTLFALHGDIKSGFGEITIYNQATGRSDVIHPLVQAGNVLCCYRDVQWSPNGEYLLFSFWDIRFSEPVRLYYISYGSIGTGAGYTPLDLPGFFFQDPQKLISPALRPVQGDE